MAQEGRKEKDHALKWLASNYFMYLPAIWGRHEWTGILGGWSWLKNTSTYPQSSQNAMELYSINNCSVIFPFILLIVIKFFLSHTWYFAQLYISWFLILSSYIIDHKFKGMSRPKLMSFFSPQEIYPASLCYRVHCDIWFMGPLFCFQQHTWSNRSFYMCSLLGIGWDNFSWFLCFLVSLKMPICM